MKTKIALFLFALSMGGSAAYAYTYPTYEQCKTECAARYNTCIASGTPERQCKMERISCMPDCMGW